MLEALYLEHDDFFLAIHLLFIFMLIVLPMISIEINLQFFVLLIASL